MPGGLYESSHVIRVWLSVLVVTPLNVAAQDVGPARGALVIVGGALRSEAIIDRGRTRHRLQPWDDDSTVVEERPQRPLSRVITRTWSEVR